MGTDGFSLLNTVTQMQKAGVADLMPSVDLASAGMRLTDISASVMNESAPVASTGTNVKELPQSPSDPRWRYRIPPPDCMKCNHPHLAGHAYDHEYYDGTPKETPMTMLDNGAAQSTGIPNIGYGVTGGVARRVAIYDSRTGYIVKVEAAPDWDDVAKIKMDKATLSTVLPLLRALKVKVKNNSEDEFDDGELAENRPALAPSTGAGLQSTEFERQVRELGLDPALVRAAGGTSHDGAGTDRQPDAAGSEQSSGAEDQR